MTKISVSSDKNLPLTQKIENVCYVMWENLKTFLKIKRTEYASPPHNVCSQKGCGEYTSSSGKATFFKNQIILNK